MLAKENITKIAKKTGIHYSEVKPIIGEAARLEAKFKLIIGAGTHPLDGKFYKLQWANVDTTGRDGKPVTAKTAPYLAHV